MNRTIVEKIISAFLKYKKSHKLTWPSILKMVNKSRAFNERISNSTLLSYFGLGGPRSVFNKVYWTPYDEEELYKLIKLILKLNGHKLITEGDIAPSIVNDSLQFEEINAVEEKGVETIYNLYYWSSEDDVNKGKLTLNKIYNTADLVISYKRDQLKLNGKYSVVNKTFFIQLEDSADPEEHAVSQIIFKTDTNSKDYFIGVFSTANRQDNYPVAGLIVIENPALTDNPNHSSYNESFIKYLLAYKRLNVENGNFLMSEISKDDDHIPVYIRQWNSIKKFYGSYEGFFINPHKARFENCLISINQSGQMKMWVYSNLSDPYQGTIKTYEDVLIVYADYKKIMDDYRIRILIEVDGYSNELFDKENDKTYYGVITGFPRGSTKPAISRFALRRVSALPIEFNNYTEKIYGIELKNENEIQKLDALLKQLNLSNFFYGNEKHELSSLGLLNMIRKK